MGTLSLTHNAELDDVLEHSKDLFAAVEAWEGHSELRVLPDEEDLRDLALSGFAKEATAELGSLASSAGPEASVAQDALGLLYRLASRQP